MGQLSKSMFVLQDYLDSLDGKYDVIFNNDLMTDVLYIRVSNGDKTIIDSVKRSGLTDENYLVDAIKNIISKIEKEGV